MGCSRADEGGEAGEEGLLGASTSSGVMGAWPTAWSSATAAARLSELSAIVGDKGSDCDAVICCAALLLEAELSLATLPDDLSDLRIAFGKRSGSRLGSSLPPLGLPEPSLWLDALRPIFLRNPPHLPGVCAATLGSTSSRWTVGGIDPRAQSSQAWRNPRPD